MLRPGWTDGCGLETEGTFRDQRDQRDRAGEGQDWGGQGLSRTCLQLTKLLDGSVGTPG